MMAGLMLARGVDPVTAQLGVGIIAGGVTVPPTLLSHESTDHYTFTRIKNDFSYTS